jgi:hypothetical protein
VAFVLFWKGIDHLSGTCDRTVSIGIDQRQKRLPEPRQVPVRDPWLIGVGVAALSVDRAEHRCRIIMIHEGARAVVNSLTGDGHIVGVHHAMDESYMHPAGNERPLFVAHALKQSEVRVRVTLQLPVMPIDCVIGETTHLGLLIAGGEQFEGARSEKIWGRIFTFDIAARQFFFLSPVLGSHV